MYQKKEYSELTKEIELLMLKVASLLMDIALGVIALKKLEKEVMKLRFQANDVLSASATVSKGLTHLNGLHSECTAFVDKLITLLCDHIISIAEKNQIQ